LAYYEENGVPPTQRQMVKDLRINRARAQMILEELREKGLLDKRGRHYIPVRPSP
jgi:DNA-binding transcriptional regulator YhcF (GntR family)